MLIKNRPPLIPTKVIENGTAVRKAPNEFDAEDFKKMEKNAKAKNLLYFGLGPNEYTRIYECESAKVTAIQEAKDMKEITLDELIGDLQIYELRRNSQQKEEIKKDRGISLKVMEEGSSDLDVEEMAVITRKFKKFFKKAKEN